MTSTESVAPRRIIDAHSHVGLTISSGVGQSIDDWVSLMDASGIQQSILSVAAGGDQSDGLVGTRRANDGVAAAVRADPTRFPLGLASVEVRHGAAGLAEVDRAFNELGLRGLAFHATFEGFSVDSAAFEAVIAAVGERSAMILVHSTPDSKASPAAIAAVAERHPALHFVLGHPVFTEGQRSEAVEVLKSFSNLSLDIAFQDDVSTIEYFVGEVGAARVLFGSDAPFFPPHRVIEAVEAASISEQDRELIFAGNAEALIAAVS
jgi:predicted TIM-barrel fold metal-dependent hydrolase